MKNITRSLLMSLALSLVATSFARAETAPDALIKQVSTDVLDAVKADKTIQAGDEIGRAHV